jgi:hypothetical protein
MQIVMMLFLLMLGNKNLSVSTVSTLARINLISALMPGWHTLRFGTDKLHLNAVLGKLYFEDSLFIQIVFAVLLYIAGRFFLNRHDILVSDAERGD